VPYFGLDFQRKIYHWIQQDYEVVGEFGQFARTSESPYAILIYKRKAILSGQ